MPKIVWPPPRAFSSKGDWILVLTVALSLVMAEKYFNFNLFQHPVILGLICLGFGTLIALRKLFFR